MKCHVEEIELFKCVSYVKSLSPFYPVPLSSSLPLYSPAKFRQFLDTKWEIVCPSVNQVRWVSFFQDWLENIKWMKLSRGPQQFLVEAFGKTKPTTKKNNS